MGSALNRGIRAPELDIATFISPTEMGNERAYSSTTRVVNRESCCQFNPAFPVFLEFQLWTCLYKTCPGCRLYGQNVTQLNVLSFVRLSFLQLGSFIGFFPELNVSFRQSWKWWWKCYQAKMILCSPRIFRGKSYLSSSIFGACEHVRWSSQLPWSGSHLGAKCRHLPRGDIRQVTFSTKASLSQP